MNRNEEREQIAIFTWAKMKEVIAHLRERGNCAVVCYGAEEAIKTINGYLNDEISNCGDNCGV